MTDEQKARVYRTEPPKLEYTRWDRFQEFGWRALLIVGLILWGLTALKTYATAACVNQNQGSSSSISTRTNAAAVGFADAILQLYTATPGDKKVTSARFKKDVTAYRDANQAQIDFRKAHPLGKC
jgi:hypothetical protein